MMTLTLAMFTAYFGAHCGLGELLTKNFVTAKTDSNNFLDRIQKENQIDSSTFLRTSPSPTTSHLCSLAMAATSSGALRALSREERYAGGVSDLMNCALACQIEEPLRAVRDI